MLRVISLFRSDRTVHVRRPVSWLLFGLLAAVGAPGCHHEEATRYESVAEPPSVRLLQPEKRKIVRVVNQPSFIEAYERTSIFPKLNAYIKEWKVDIGDKVKKDQVLATLFVPELVEDHETKKATVVLDRERVALAKEVVEVADADVKAAKARVEEAQAELNSHQAEVNRWDSEVYRLEREVARGIVTPQDLLQATNRLKASTAARDAAQATVLRAEAELLSREAALAKAKVDVRVAEADLKVAESEERRMKVWVDYLVLPSPYDGIVVARNANTFDFVLPATGDPSADPHAPRLSASGQAAPIYAVARTDKVRIFVDIPEAVSNYVQIGTKASVLAKGYRDEPFPGTVTRTSWALNANSRTLRAEIDLPNPKQQLLPGMYAYGKVVIERPNVRALPAAAPVHLDDNTFCEVQGCKREHVRISALTSVGEKNFCWLYQDGHAVRTEIQTGLSDGKWIEVTNHRKPAAANGAEEWVPFDGKEQVMLGDLSILVDGGPVRIAEEKAEEKAEAKATSETPHQAQPAPKSHPHALPQVK
jgi:HlyD family secretion protein